MGAGVSTEGAPLTRVKCKNNLGVLFDHKAEEAFKATATGPEGAETVPWPEADAYVKTRDERWRVNRRRPTHKSQMQKQPRRAV